MIAQSIDTIVEFRGAPLCCLRMRNAILHGKSCKNPCVLCSAAAYCCGAVAPRAIAALLGRFLPRLGPLVIQAALFSFGRHLSADTAHALTFDKVIPEFSLGSSSRQRID